jgi:hypothetical protein
MFLFMTSTVPGVATNETPGNGFSSRAAQN